MAHLCPTCGETCYCGGDHDEINTGNRPYCMHCCEYNHDSNDLTCDDLRIYDNHEE